MAEIAVGIDLGTSNTCVSMMVDGEVKVLENAFGERTSASVVHFHDDGSVEVGNSAKAKVIHAPAMTVSSAKRLIGRYYFSEEVKKAQAIYAYEIVEAPNHGVRIEIRDEEFSLPEISAMVLREMKQIAERHAGEQVTKAVITVPAYFNDNQRQATKDAGRIAGLEVIRIINEPTAAALAYGFGKDLERKVAVYDLGGGTFDVSILDIGHGVFEVISTAGDTFLGGEDFDIRVMDWLIQSFVDSTGVDVRDDRMALQRLRDAAEKARCELSVARETLIDLPFLYTTPNGDTYHLQENLTRDQLEELTRDLVQRTVHICERTMQEANIDRGDLDDVILVGGMTRMPLISELVSEFFGLEPCKGVHPDEVVALGAAIQAAALLDDSQDLLLLDVTPHSLGIMIVGGYFHKLIPQNTTVPTSASHIFTTVRDNQTSVKILVLQGESEKAAENELLGEFALTNLRKAPRGQVEVEVTFSISADGIVSVAAKDLETGHEQSITVTATSGLTEEELQKLVEQSQGYMVEVRASEEFERTKIQVEKLVDEVRSLFPQVKDIMSGTSFGRDAISKADAVLQRADQEMQGRDVRTLNEVQESLERTLNMFRGVVSKTSLT